jgi:hypothetical protein
MKQKILIPVLFYGALWGIVEATIGHILHFIPATIAGSILFPFAAMILYKAYQKTSSIKALFFISIVASTIKSVNFLLPALSIYKTINPMISIVLEGLVVVLVIAMVTSEKPMMQVAGWLTASISWRILFVGWMGAQYLITGNLAPYIAEFSAFVEFVLLSGVISGIFTILLIYLQKNVSIRWNLDQQWSAASLLLAIALVLTYTL